MQSTITPQVLKLCFPKDLRVNEVRRLLQSSKPVRVALTQKPEVRYTNTINLPCISYLSTCCHGHQMYAFVCSDHEFIEQQETHLLAVCQRTMALPIGRLVPFARYESLVCDFM